MKAAAIIQARMGSTRLPGKMLKPIMGQPLLWHVVHRLRRSRHIGDIVVATSTAKADDALAAYAETLGVKSVRGPEANVLSRFLMAAGMVEGDILVRVCGDSPLVDAGLVDQLIDAMAREGADTINVKPGVACIHEGVDLLSRRALLKLAAEAGDDPIAREHVTGYFKAHPGFVKTAVFDLDAAYQFSGARISIDCPADVTFIEAVYDKLGATAGEASLTDLVALLRRDASLLSINAHVKQKTVSQTSGTILVRCDAGPERGFGHVKRSLALAQHLRDREGFGVVFAMANDAAGMAPVEAAGFPIAVWPADMDEESWIATLLHQYAPKALILDIRTSLSRDSVGRLKQANAMIVAYDDASERRLAADIALLPPTAEAKALKWWDGDTEALVGWEWVVLGHERPLRRGRLPTTTPNVLITMGGSDPWSWTVPSLRAAVRLTGSFSLTVVIGPGFADRANVMAEVRRIAPQATILDAPADLGPAMAEADLAITAFGVSALEFASAGVPAIYLCPTADHAASAAACVASGFGVSLGAAETVPEVRLTATIEGLINNPERRRQMSAAGRHAIDGRGAERVAGLIAERLRQRARPMLRVVNGSGGSRRR